MRQKLPDDLASLIAVPLYLAAFAVLTWPALGSFSSHLIGDAGDGLANYWNLWWVDRAVTAAASPWHTDLLYHPDGVSLHGHTLNPFNGLLSIPLRWFLPPFQVYNTIVVFAFVATGLTTFWLARHLSGNAWWSLFTGAAFTFSSYHFMRAYGHLDLVSLEWVPLFVLLWIRLLDRPSFGRALLAAVALLLVQLCNQYYTVFCVLAGAVLLAHRAIQHRADPLHFLRRQNLYPLATFVLASTALVGPLLLGLRLADRADPLLGSHDPNQFGLDLLAPFVPGASWAFADWTSWFWDAKDPATGGFLVGGNPIASCAYIRYSLLVPAAYAALRARRLGIRDAGAWVAVGAVFFLLALGPTIKAFGAALPVPGLPYRLLEVVLPPLRMSGAPGRMIVVVMLCTALLANYALPALWRQAHPAVRALWLALFLFESWPYALPLTRPAVPDYIGKLVELPPGAVAGLAGTPLELYYQTLFQKPITTGYLARRPQSVAGRRALQEQMLREGRHRELLDRLDARYLVTEKFDPHRARLAQLGLELIFLGGTHDLVARSEDPLPPVEIPQRDCASGAQVETRIERDPASGAPVALHLDALADAGRRFVVGFSLATAPPIRLLDGRTIPLAVDAVFELSTNGANHVFAGNHGHFDDAGRAVVRLDFGAEVAELLALRGRVLHYCVAVYDATAPLEVCRITGRGELTVPE